MMATGFMEMIVLFFPLATNAPPDLVSLMDAQDYFQEQSIKVEAAAMVKAAGAGAKNGQAPIGQLLAIRWLGENRQQVTGYRGARELLEQIAAGKKANDTLGFARDYARQALARLDNKPIPAPTLPSGSLRGDALSWFPAKSTIFGGYDFRSPQQARTKGDDFFRSFIKMMPPRERKPIYDFADKVGNFRLDRVSFAVIPDPNQEDQTRMFFRFTGLGDGKRLVNFIRTTEPNAEIKERKGADGEPLVIINMKNHGPAMAIVGNNELLVAGYAGGRNQQDHSAVLEEALKIRDADKGSIVKGPYAGTLKAAPAKANGLVIGDLPDVWYKGVTGQYSPFKGFPQSFNLSMVRSDKGIDVRFNGSAPNAQEAKAFVDSAEKLRQQAISGLDLLPPAFKVKPKSLQALKTALKGIKLEARDALLTGSAMFSREAIQAVMDLAKAAMGGLVGLRGQAQPVERATVKEKERAIVKEKDTATTKDKTTVKEKAATKDKPKKE